MPKWVLETESPESQSGMKATEGLLRTKLRTREDILVRNSDSFSSDLDGQRHEEHTGGGE